MNGNELFIDTNIVLYLLNGEKTIAKILDGKTIYISFITELELLGFKGLTSEQKPIIENFLGDVILMDIDFEIKSIVISLRKKYSIKLPDAIIAASSIKQGLTLLTADKGFGKITELDSIIYEL
jgi:predicted nucleic acid-binding protein